MSVTIALIIFWLSVGCMFHSYLLYPLLLKLFSSGRRENDIVYSLNDSSLPSLTIIFSVFNEQAVIRQKLESVFNTTYPLDKLRVYIGSDNSTDETNRIIEEFRSKHPQLYFLPFAERQGKSMVLNKLVSEIQSGNDSWQDKVFVFTDANVMFTPDTLYELARHFKNESIGIVGANVLNHIVNEEGIAVQEKTYIRNENSIKYLEGLNWGTMMGAFGACYAMRAACWKPIPKNFLMEDFYLTMGALQTGRKAILNKDAICYEDVSSELSEEYKRKSRIQAGNLQNLSVYWRLLFRPGALSFCFFSHKLLRWKGPVFIAASYFANVFLLNEGRLYLLTFVLQNILLLSPVIDWFLKRMRVNVFAVRFVSYFYMMNLALLNGFVMYAKGIRTNAWSPTKRNI